MVIDAVQVRWQVEEFYRSFKQLTEAEKCQCRTANAQRNHLQCCYSAWVSLRQHARTLGQTIYQAHQQQWVPYLRNLLLEQFSGSCTRRGWGSSRNPCGADPSSREESQTSSTPT